MLNQNQAKLKLVTCQDAVALAVAFAAVLVEEKY
jgi:hypothetical protein